MCVCAFVYCAFMYVRMRVCVCVCARVRVRMCVQACQPRAASLPLLAPGLSLPMLMQLCAAFVTGMPAA